MHFFDEEDGRTDKTPVIVFFLKTKTLQRSLDSVPYEFANEKDRRAAWYMKFLGR